MRTAGFDPGDDQFLELCFKRALSSNSYFNLVFALLMFCDLFTCVEWPLPEYRGSLRKVLRSGQRLYSLVFLCCRLFKQAQTLRSLPGIQAAPCRTQCQAVLAMQVESRVQQTFQEPQAWPSEGQARRVPSSGIGRAMG